MMKKVLIIGATSGIAQALCHELAVGGAQLVLWARSGSKLDLLAADLRVQHGVTVHCEVFDFNNFDLHQQALEKAARNGIDLAVICHGTLSDQQACEKDFAVAVQEFRTNCLSALSFLTLLANYFETQRSGCIVAISSVAGDRGRQSNYVYGSAKAALSVFLGGLRNRLYRSGVHVLTVKPGFVDTPMTAHMRKGILFTQPASVARDIVRAIDRKDCVIYTPWFWRYIMLVIRLIPESLFRKLKL